MIKILKNLFKYILRVIIRLIKLIIFNIVYICYIIFDKEDIKYGEYE